MKSIGEILPLASSYLQEHKIGQPRHTAEELLAAVLSVKRIDLYLQYDRLLTDQELEKMRGYLARSKTGEPIAYILGEVEFATVSIETSQDVLIPRPETEILAEEVKKKLQGPLFGKVLWDLCTGSGCIGLSLKKAFPDLTVILSDICPKALATAQRNAARNNLALEYRLGDLLEPFKGEKADFVVCNPPYVSKEEYDSLDRSVRDFEPKIALLGGNDGLGFFQRLSSELPAHLTPGAQIFFEIGCNQGAQVEEIFQEAFWRKKEIKKDWAGHDRFFFLEIE